MRHLTLKRALGAAVIAVLVVAGAVYGIAASSSPSTTKGAVAAPTSTAVSLQLPPTATPVAPSSGAAPTLEPSPSTPGRAEPDGQRILADDKYLADTIGPRPAGTQKEQQAADFIADRLRSLGYDVTLQEFSIGTQTGRSSDLSLVTPQPGTISTLPLAQSATGDVQGRVVSAGIGQPSDFPPDTKGAIVLLQRGDLLFNDKVTNAESAGAIGVIIYNNAPDLFYGTLSTTASIPALAISGDDGATLLSQVQAGGVTAKLSVGALSGDLSHNVIATPPGKQCETVTGGHYDSVPQAPGASDNGTGTATVLEIAAMMAKNGEMGSNCFVLFGGEELGLLGSKYYVSQLDQAAKARLKAMLNFDMVGVGDQAWWLIGSSDLQQRMGAIAKQIGINDTMPSTLIRGLSSDHASFEAAGIPVLMFHRWEDPLLHTPQDVSSRVQPQYLEQAARMGVALLESLNAGG